MSNGRYIIALLVKPIVNYIGPFDTYSCRLEGILDGHFITAISHLAPLSPHIEPPAGWKDLMPTKESES